MKTNRMMLCLITLLLGGCLPPSLHPLYSDETLIFKDELLGKWLTDDDGIWRFRRAGKRKYEVTMYDPEEFIGPFETHLVEIDGAMYLDLFPESTPLDELSDFYKLHIFPVHTFMKVDQIGHSMEMRWMDYNKMTDILDDDPNVLKHEIVDGSVLLTADTQALQNFMASHAETLFGDMHDEADETSGMMRLEAMYTDDDIVFDVNLIGLWEAPDGSVLDFQQLGENVYDLMYVEDDDTQYHFYGNLVTCGVGVLMAVFTDDAELDRDTPDAYAFHLIPDWFWIVEHTETGLKLEEMEYEEISEMLQNQNSPSKPQSRNASYWFEGDRIEQ